MVLNATCTMCVFLSLSSVFACASCLVLWLWKESALAIALAIHLGTHTSKHHELSSKLHLCLTIEKDFMDHWHEIRESVLWVTESQRYWTCYSYCRHCVASCNWCCLVSLALQQELLPWKTLWILGCTVKQKLWKICAVVGRPGQSRISDVDSVSMYRFMLCCCISSLLSFPSLRSEYFPS